MLGDILDNKSVLVTGGTGSFGNHFVGYALEHCSPRRVIVYSRDEYKQFVMADRFREYGDALRFFIGDVRDRDRLRRAFRGVDYVVHAAAMKQVPACEYNPIEAVRTNIDGATNVVDAALDSGSVRRVVALSTDKSVNPVNLYGGTKLVSDKLFIAANAYTGGRDLAFSVVRYGNVAGSRGSVIPFFGEIIGRGGRELPITDHRMTRFWIDLEGGVELVMRALRDARGGETFISRIPSFRVTDLAEAMLPGCGKPEVGIREGEKLHEVMVTAEDAPATYEYDGHYVIYPRYRWWGERVLPGGRPVPDGFQYDSGSNTEWLGVGDLRTRLDRMGWGRTAPGEGATPGGGAP